MKIRLLLLYALVLSIGAYAQSDFSVTILAGSNAPWGENQYLYIDAKGHCKYVLSDVNAGPKDSSSFTIPKAGLKEINEAINEAHFMTLDRQYKTDARDGSKLFISITSGRRSHSVELINKDLPAISLLLKRLNTVLATNKIHIDY